MTTYHESVKGFLCKWLVGRLAHASRPSAVEYRPADVVSQPLIVQDKIANRIWQLVALPPALEPPCALALSFRRGSTCGLDRIGGRTQLVRGDVRDDCCLTSSICGMPGCPAQASSRGHCMAACRASLGHRDLATRPGAGMLDCSARSRVLRLSRLEEVKNMLRAQCRPKSEELMIRIGEGSTTADGDEARVAIFGEYHAAPI